MTTDWPPTTPKPANEPALITRRAQWWIQGRRSIGGNIRASLFVNSRRCCVLAQERIRYLLDYEDAFNDAHELFCRGRNQSPLLQAIAHLRILDPAVGSGAFLMAVLHKLPLALRRLDPYN